MSYKIRLMEEHDRTEVLSMMRTFYTSPAVLTDGSEEIYNADIDNCVSDSPYLEGYIFEDNNTVLGYAMVAKSFSTEFGRPCIWIEDLYLKEKYRNRGIGSGFFKFIEDKYLGSIFRLEAEEENKTAIKVYKKAGFDILPYLEMKKL
jgi:GNAT superfamily N-acetyltransferase